VFRNGKQYLGHVSHQTCYSCYTLLTTKCSGTVSSTLSTCDTRCVTLATQHVWCHTWSRYCLPFLNTWLLVGVTRGTRLVSHVDKVLLTVPEQSVVSGCNKSNTSGVTRGQRVTLVTPTNNQVFKNGKQYLLHVSHQTCFSCYTH
jgi:uncharacterized C2H2 Zn-finger protein